MREFTPGGLDLKKFSRLMGRFEHVQACPSVISLLILNMTGFYPRKLISNDYMSFNKKLFTKLQFVKNMAVSNIILKKGE
jgi:hypothetical protein